MGDNDLFRGREDLEKLVADVIVEQLSVEREKVVPTASFIDDLGADSLDLVELILAFEEQFEVEIPDNEAEKIKTVMDAVNYIENYQSEEYNC